MKSIYDFQNGYQYFLHTVNEILDGTERRRRIEIAEWKLGIYNPYSTIDYVDFEDNPHYVGWYTELTFFERLYHVPQRFGKPTFTAICARQDIRSSYGIKSN